MDTIELGRKAADLRKRAGSLNEELKATLTAQLGDDYEGESRLSADEITAKTSEIQDIIAQAAALEGVAASDSLMDQKAGRLAPEAGRIVDSAVADQVKDSSVWGEKVNSGLSHFLRAVRAKSGQYGSHVELTDEQKYSVRKAFYEATAWDRDELTEKTVVGDDTGSAGRGDYLVPTEHSAELLRIMAEKQQFISRARRIPMARRVIDFPRLAQTTNADTRPLHSFAAITKIAEGAQKPEREATFEQLTMTAIKYAAYVEASDELLLDSIVDLPPVLVGLLTDAIAYEYDRDGILGSGTAEPQGFIGSAAEYAVNRANANEISVLDIMNMESRFFGNDGAFYLFSPSAIPQLYRLAESNLIVWSPNLQTGAPGTLMGRELVKTHKAPLLGAKGDLSLVDPSFYLRGDLQRVSVANSIHYQFRNDVTAWRATFRGAGTPWPAGPFSHESDGTNKTYEVSPFVVLDVPGA